ncbi:MAG: PAS domain S-box protein [Candidatus Heimdallarchaeota archaeon]|nr:PAS domain S-box protein [Candidatus Heimdallarchaeota archaeon]
MSEEIDNRRIEQVVGKLLSEAFPGSEEGGFAAQIRRVWLSGETERVLLSFYQDDIISGWRKNYTYRLPSKEVVHVYKDVTKEQQYLKQLITSEEKFRSVFNHSVDGYILRDEDGTVIEYNQKLVEIYGYDKEDLESVNGAKIGTVENIDDLQKIRTMLASKGQAFLETKFMKKDKTWVSTEVSAIKFNLAGRDVVFSILRDISERKKAEEELKSSEEGLRNLFENIPLAISINSSDGELIDINPAFWELFGYDNKEECLITPFTNRWFNIRDCERLYNSLRQRNFVQNFETKRYKKDGSDFWGSITAIAQLETSGERVYFTTLRDITTEKQKEENLKRQNLRYYLEESHLYLSEEEKPYISKEAFSDLLRVGYNGLVLSRLPETEWKKNINYEFDFFRIAERGHLKTISSELSKIEQLIEELPSKHIIVIDRLDYLIVKNGFESTLFFIFRLMDIAYLSNHIIIVALDPATINEKERKSLRKEMRMIESMAEATLPEELIEILELVHKRNITGGKPSYTDIVEVFSISRPTARKRIKDLINEEYIFELTKGRSKVLGITAKGKAVFD